MGVAVMVHDQALYSDRTGSATPWQTGLAVQLLLWGGETCQWGWTNAHHQFHPALSLESLDSLPFWHLPRAALPTGLCTARRTLISDISILAQQHECTQITHDTYVVGVGMSV